MYSALVVSLAGKLYSALSEALPPEEYSPLASASSASEARELSQGRVYELYFINASPHDDEARRLAVDAAESGAVVLLILNGDDYARVREEARALGILTVERPVSLPMLVKAADFMCALAERQRRLRSRTAAAEEKLEDMKLVNRAKWLLIDNLKMTEAEAHRYIERQAMDRCGTKRSVAETIIKTYKDS